MINFDDVAKEYIKEHNLSWPETPDHLYRILIVGCSGFGKTNLLNHEPDIDKLFLCVKDPYKAKYQLLINKRQDRNLKYFNNSKAFIEY